ncbi:MAG: hypothetical protein ABWZ88_07860 [Variovorax sp.]
MKLSYRYLSCAAGATLASMALAQSSPPPAQVVPVTGVAVGTGPSQAAACESANATARQQMRAKAVTEGNLGDCDCEYAPTSRTHSCSTSWVAKPMRSQRP